MDNIIPENRRIKLLQDILADCARIFMKLGYRNQANSEMHEGRQIVFENEILGDILGFQLTVVSLNLSTKVNSLTFNFDCQLIPGRNSPIKLQEREIKDIKVQLIEEETSKQLLVQLYFAQPLNYSSEDLVYRVKVDNLPGGIKLATGYPWLTAKMHMDEDAVMEVVRQIQQALEA